MYCNWIAEEDKRQTQIVGIIFTCTYELRKGRFIPILRSVEAFNR